MHIILISRNNMDKKGGNMKTILVFSLLAISTFLLVIIMDFLMNFSLSNLLWKQLKPFKVTEMTETVILGLFALYFVTKAIVGFLKKKQNQQSSQQTKNENSPS
jgi:ABC-type transport system involved in cytochrome bd biosynthesis fused ATPase/permease subunit